MPRGTLGPRRPRAADPGRLQAAAAKLDLRMTYLGILVFGLIVCRVGEFVPLFSRLRPVMLMGAVGSLFLFKHWKKLGVERLLNDKIVLLAAGLFFWAMATIPFALWRGQAFESLTIYPICLFTMVTIALVPARKERTDFFLMGATVMAFFTASMTYLFGQMEAGRLTQGGTLDPNDLASLLAMTLPFGIAMGVDAKRAGALKRYSLWGVAAGLAWILLLTGSRGGFVALLVGLAIMLARLNPKRSIVFLLLIVVASPLLWKATPVEIRDRFVSIGNLEDDYNLTDEFGRIATWKRGLGYIAEHPFTGLGWGNFQVAEGERLQALGTVGPHYTAHNTYIQVTAELGILGGILFFLMLWEAAKRAFRLWVAGRPEYLSALGAFCAAGVFLSHAYSYMLYGLLGIIILSSRASGNDGAKRRRPKRVLHPALARKRPLMHQAPPPPR